MGRAIGRDMTAGIMLSFSADKCQYALRILPSKFLQNFSPNLLPNFLQTMVAEGEPWFVFGSGRSFKR